MVVKGEGLTRLEAERRLVKLYKDEYERLERRRGHVDAMRSLVRAHKNRYNTLVRKVHDERPAWRTQGTSATTSGTAA